MLLSLGNDRQVVNGISWMLHVFAFCYHTLARLAHLFTTHYFIFGIIASTNKRKYNYWKHPKAWNKMEFCKNINTSLQIPYTQTIRIFWHSFGQQQIVAKTILRKTILFTPVCLFTDLILIKFISCTNLY